MFNKLQTLQGIISQHQQQIHQLQFLLKENLKCQNSSSSTTVKQILIDFDDGASNFSEVFIKQLSQQKSHLKNSQSKEIISKVLKGINCFLDEFRVSLVTLKQEIQQQHQLLFKEFLQQMKNFKQFVFRIIRKKKLPLKQLNSNQNLNLDFQHITVKHELVVPKKDKRWINQNFQSSLHSEQYSEFYAKNQHKLQEYLEKNSRQHEMQKFYENIDVIKEQEAQWDEQTNTFRITSKQSHQQFVLDQQNLHCSTETITSTKNAMPAKLIEKVQNLNKRKKSMEIPHTYSAQNQYMKTMGMSLSLKNQQNKVKKGDEFTSSNRFQKSQSLRQCNENVWKKQKMKNILEQLDDFKKSQGLNKGLSRFDIKNS